MAMIDPSMRQRLLHLAQQAIVARVHRGRAPAPFTLDLHASGVFVTVYHRGELRGCLGTLDPREKVPEAIIRLAGDVTHRDRRFDPLTLPELIDVTVDVSVLTPPVLVREVSEILIGRDGLIVEFGRAKGLLLPQVATEHGFDRETFLGHTCRKAGLEEDAWRTGATIYRFQAEVFGSASHSVRSVRSYVRYVR
jgi:AmmeMemoRadiSam system protein A